MKPIAGIRPETGQQLSLWPALEDVPFKSCHQASPYLGDWAEQYAAWVTKGLRLTTDSTATCPDLQLGPNHYGEVKAVSNSRKCFMVYKPRYDAYCEMVRRGMKLHFVIVHHDCVAGELKSLHHLRQQMARRVEHVSIIPAQTVLEWISHRVKSHGWSYQPKRKEAYQHFVRIGDEHLAPLRDAKPYRAKRAHRTSIQGHRVDFTPVRLYRTQIPDMSRIGWHEPLVREKAEVMLAEFEQHHLDVVVTPIPGDPNGRGYRQVVSQNVEWYQRIYAACPSIRRRNIRSGLQAMIDDRPLRRSLEQVLLPFVDEYEINPEEPWQAWADEPADAGVPF